MIDGRIAIRLSHLRDSLHARCRVSGSSPPTARPRGAGRRGKGEELKTSTTMKLVAGAAAIGAAVLLIGPATGTTGAYFTESKSGSINASTGGVHLNTTDLTLNFPGLLPGEFQTKDIVYTATGSGLEDIWLVLPTDGSADSLNGTPGTPSGNAAYGRYGHFAVTAPDGSFTSYNLASPGTGIHSGPSCSVDAYGRGGSDTQAVDRNDHTVPFCPVPNAILLSYGIATGVSGTAHVTFGFTKLLNNPGQEDSPPFAVASFKIVATQHGVFPNDPNN